MRRILLALFAIIALAIPLSSAQAEDKEPLAYSCGLSGKLGNPIVKNIGPRNPVVVMNATNQNKLYVNVGERWCPGWVYVHAGYDIRVQCSNGLYYWRTSFGWRKLHEMCSWNGGSSTITFNEKKQ